MSKNVNEKSWDNASRELITEAKNKDVEIVWDRFEAQQPQCKFGKEGVCCRICSMGPCRIIPGKKDRGVCGATVETIVARNFIRMVAGGAAAHSDHGRGVTQIFLKTARGEVPGYEIKDEVKLKKLAHTCGIDTEDKEKKEIAVELGELLLAEFGKQEGTLNFLKRAPEKRQEIWKELDIEPRGIDREIVEIMHRTHMGVDQEYKNLLLQGARASLADGWGGSMIATELQDIMFGTPGGPWEITKRQAEKLTANLGVLKEDKVNIIVHGHEPLLSEMITVAARDPELIELAKENGAEGINLAGICCTANEILMRHGIPLAGNFLQQELAIITGAVDLMIVDVQCIMQGLSRVKNDFHTEVITTSPKAKIADIEHLEFDEEDALESAKMIVKKAIENYPHRQGVNIPEEKEDAVAGFSHEYINYMLGGVFRSSYWPLNSNIIDGRIRGVAGVVGCNNAKVPHDEIHVKLVEELIANDVLVVQTGCSAIASAKEGLMKPEAALKKAGPGLREVCETVGIPPVLHVGSCVDNSRILMALSEMVKVGKENNRLSLGNDISDLPVAGAAPEWMSEKAISIGQYFVASGVYTVFGVDFPTTGSKNVTEFLFDEFSDLVGGKWDCEPDPHKMAQKMIAHIDAKRKELGIEKIRERELFDMEKRREMK